MADHILKDKQNRLVGRIRTTSGGVLEIRDASNRLKGKYDPKTNITRDARNLEVGKGNWLSALL